MRGHSSVRDAWQQLNSALSPILDSAIRLIDKQDVRLSLGLIRGEGTHLSGSGGEVLLTAYIVLCPGRGAACLPSLKVASLSQFSTFTLPVLHRVFIFISSYPVLVSHCVQAFETRCSWDEEK